MQNSGNPYSQNQDQGNPYSQNQANPYNIELNQSALYSSRAFKNDQANDDTPSAWIAKPQPLVNGVPMNEQIIEPNYNLNGDYLGQPAVKQPLMNFNGPPPPSAFMNVMNGLYARARERFVFKVYSIVAFQLLITAGICCATMFSPAFFYFQLDNYWIVYIGVALMIISQIVIFCSEAGRRYPVNIIMLIVFTIGESWLVSIVCGIVADEPDGNKVVLVAALMCLGLVVFLTVFTFIAKPDFSLLLPILLSAVWSFCLFGIFCWISWSPLLTNLYCALGVIVFSIYLIIDTMLIAGNSRSIQLGLDDYVVGALIIYMDIIQIFLYLLMLLGKK